MQDFKNKLAVITGGGTGMGRELAIQLAAEGCHVAICDIFDENMQQTLALCQQVMPTATRVTTHLCDVSKEEDVLRFRDELKEQHQVEHINLLFNNAGVDGGRSFVNGDRDNWEKTFNICWYGVYYCTRAFMPLLVASDEGHIVNISSVNGFWACLGSGTNHTAYCTAKFAVKGFSESLLVDLRLNAPHVGLSVVMPGHVGTALATNSRKLHYDLDSSRIPPQQIAQMRAMAKRRNMDVSHLRDAELVEFIDKSFRERGLSAKQAATNILQAVRNKEWRVLIGEDAKFLDAKVRQNPEQAYDPAFSEQIFDTMLRTAETQIPQKVV